MMRTFVALLLLAGSQASRNGSRGLLICNGRRVDSEVIYWKDIPEDLEYESPITPHHNEHDVKYITFEYDHGGW